MADDLADVPRRLRRFYRNGQLPPSPNAPASKKNTPSFSRPSREEEGMGKEELGPPWLRPRDNNSTSPRAPSGNDSYRARRKAEMENPLRNNPTESKRIEPGEKGLFSRSRENFSPEKKPVDHVLGLPPKNTLGNRLPSASQAAIQTPKDEVAAALEEIKKLNSPHEEGDPSVHEMARHVAELNENEKSPALQGGMHSPHFTPRGSIPNPVNTETLHDARNLPAQSIPSSNSPSNAGANLSPRERMEQRRLAHQSGNPMGVAPNPSVPSAPGRNSSAPANAPPTPANTPSASHFRRRLGKLEGNESESIPVGKNPPNNNPAEPDEMNDLFGDEKNNTAKKKKKGNDSKDEPVDENEELDDESDMELFEDEK